MTHFLSLKPVLIKVVAILLLCTMLVPCAAVMVPMRVEAGGSKEIEDEKQKQQNINDKNLTPPFPEDIYKEVYGGDKGDNMNIHGASAHILCAAASSIGFFVAISNYFAVATSECFSGGNSIGGVAFDSISDLSDGVIEALKPVGYAIALCFFFISLIELAMEDRFTIELFVKFFAKFIAAYAAIYFSGEFTTKIVEFGNALASFIVTGTQSLATTNGPLKHAADFVKAVDDEFADGGSPLFTCLCLVVILWEVVILLLMFMLALIIVVYVICASRLIELMVRACFMPIALGLLSDDGWRGAAGRYVKRFVAVAAQGAVLVMIGTATSTLFTSALNLMANASGSGVAGIFIGFWKTAIVLIAIGFASVKTMTASQQIINDVFGG